MSAQPSSRRRRLLEGQTLLATLRGAHGELLRDMTAMDRLATVQLPDPSVFAHARQQILSSTFEWHAASERASHWLLGLVQNGEAATLLALQGVAREVIQHIDAHIDSWDQDKIQADWNIYSAAGHALRWRLRSCLSCEQRHLYRLLEQVKLQK